MATGQLGMIGWERAGTSGSGSGRQVESARSGNLPQAAELTGCFEGPAILCVSPLFIVEAVHQVDRDKNTEDEHQ